MWKYKPENKIVYLEKKTGVLYIHVHHYVNRTVVSVISRMNGYSKRNLESCEMGSSFNI